MHLLNLRIRPFRLPAADVIPVVQRRPDHSILQQADKYRHQLRIKLCSRAPFQLIDRKLHRHAGLIAALGYQAVYKRQDFPPPLPACGSKAHAALPILP